MVRGCVRTIVNRIQVGTGVSELLDHKFVNRMNERFREVAATNPGLICYDNHRQTGLV